MTTRPPRITSIILLLFILVSITVHARTAIDYDEINSDIRESGRSDSAGCAAQHRIGKIGLTVNNRGQLGNGYFSTPDCFTGETIASCEYPISSGNEYLFGSAFWIGAVVGSDTLVSVGADGWRTAHELHTDQPLGYMIHRSVNNPYTPDAVSEDDIIAAYADTIWETSPLDYLDLRPHRPLNIKLHQNSYAWSNTYAEDIILFDYRIENLNTYTLESVYMGIFVDADVGFSGTCTQNTCYIDDISGFIHTRSTSYGTCQFNDTLNIAWSADNDGDPNGGTFGAESVPHVTATALLKLPSDNAEVSFNWWISNFNSALDFGPRERSGKGRLPEDYRDFTTGGLGTPMGDRNKYYMMRNLEFDYDQIYTKAILLDDTLWMYPAQTYAHDFSNGYDTRYLLSFGPFTIEPGESAPVVFVYVAGENFHVDPDNYTNNLRFNYNPDEYYSNLDFSDLTNNVRMASWIYDTPGYDTDGDGYSGKFHICCDSSSASCDTFYYEGDGIPDFNRTFFICGDANGDSLVNLDDVAFLQDYYFRCDAQPFPAVASDLNCDGSIDIQDIIRLVRHLNGTGPPPCCLE